VSISSVGSIEESLFHQQRYARLIECGLIVIADEQDTPSGVGGTAGHMRTADNCLPKQPGRVPQTLQWTEKEEEREKVCMKAFQIALPGEREAVNYIAITSFSIPLAPQNELTAGREEQPAQQIQGAFVRR
jgi:hypothetical protein